MSKHSNRFIQEQHAFVDGGDPKHVKDLLAEFRGLYDFLCRATPNEIAAKNALEDIAKKLAVVKYEGDEDLFEGWLYRLAVDASSGQQMSPAMLQELQDLPEELREAFLLSHYAKLTPEQVGVALRITQPEAVARIERAVTLLLAPSV